MQSPFICTVNSLLRCSSSTFLASESSGFCSSASIIASFVLQTSKIFLGYFCTVFGSEADFRGFLQSVFQLVVCKFCLMDYTIKDLPESERPREKLEDRGVDAMTDVELLSIILRTGTSGKNVKELSSDILNSYSVGELADRGLDDLKEFQGVSRVKAGQLKALGELSRRMEKQDREKIDSLSDVKSMTEDMKYLEEEKLRTFYLSSGNELLGSEEFDGSVSSVGAEPRKLFKHGLSLNASAFIIVHNHPSGRCEATDQDLEMTRQILGTGRDLGLELLDHVIVGDGFLSMRNSSELSFQ